MTWSLLHGVVNYLHIFMNYELEDNVGSGEWWDPNCQWRVMAGWLHAIKVNDIQRS